MPIGDNPIEFRLERSQDLNQPYVWFVYTAGGERTLAYSETYTSRYGAINAVEQVKSGNASYEVFQGSDARWYFRIQAVNGRILARSGYSYADASFASGEADLIRLNAAWAPFYDYAQAA
jgi:uncharacterized protein YegP (UPF0339 family)